MCRRGRLLRHTYIGTSNSEVFLVNIPSTFGPITISAGGGADLVAGDSTGDGNLFDGGPGENLVSNSSKQDYLVGEEGDDYGYVGSRDVFLGRNGNDVGYAFPVDNFVEVTRIPGQRYHVIGSRQKWQSDAPDDVSGRAMRWA